MVGFTFACRVSPVCLKFGTHHHPPDTIRHCEHSLWSSFFPLSLPQSCWGSVVCLQKEAILYAHTATGRGSYTSSGPESLMALWVYKIGGRGSAFHVKHRKTTANILTWQLSMINRSYSHLRRCTIPSHHRNPFLFTENIELKIPFS